MESVKQIQSQSYGDKKYLKVPIQPRLQNEEDKLHIICVYDASGSMNDVWAWVAEFHNKSIPKKNCYTLTFDQNTYICQSNTLQDRLYAHGGGATAIPEAFMKMEEYLNNLPADHSATIIFISDGCDNQREPLSDRMKKLQGNTKNRTINFICLGVGNKFPHFLSMELRQLYHKGDEAIPALYLIEYPSQKAFFNKFEGIKNYFFYTKLVNIQPSIKIYPWSDKVENKAYEGQYIIVEGDEIILEKEIVIKEFPIILIEDAVDLIRGWVQQLHMLQLKNDPGVKMNTKIAIIDAEMIVTKISQYLKINIRKNLKQQMSGNPSFYELAKFNYVERYGNKINWFFEELDAILLGQQLKEQEEFEAAKKMNLGTISGKYFQKLLALEKLTTDVFNNLKNEFVQKFQEFKKIEQISNHNFKKLVMQKDFIEAMEFITNQFDLMEQLPLSGRDVFDKN